MNHSSRRSFIKSAAGIAGASLAGFPFLSVANETAPVKNNLSKPITRTLGKTGIVLPVVSMGVMNANNPNLVKEAWKAGIRHFDTAWVYQNGNNEKMIGNMMKELKVNRKEVIIASKFILRSRMAGSGKEAKERMMSQVNESLSRLQTGYLDLLYIHDVSEVGQITDPAVLEGFSELKKQGKIRFCGFSTHSYWPEILNHAAGMNFYDALLISWNISLSQDPACLAAMKKAHDAGIGLVAMKTQCQQDWYKDQLPSEVQKFYEGRIMHTALLKWALRNEFITTAVPGFTTFQQMEEDLTVNSNLEYSAEEKQFLTDRNVKFALQQVCRHCGDCVEGCPYQADIPSLMRTHMYSFSYGNAFLARQTLGQVAPERGLDACSHCRECTASCSRSVPVNERISALKEIYA